MKKLLVFNRESEIKKNFVSNQNGSHSIFNKESFHNRYFLCQLQTADVYIKFPLMKNLIYVQMKCNERMFCSQGKVSGFCFNNMSS